MLMPGTSCIVGMGKDGIFRVVNTSTWEIQRECQQRRSRIRRLSNAFFSSPIYWNSPNNGPVVYIWEPADFLKAFELTGPIRDLSGNTRHGCEWCRGSLTRRPFLFPPTPA